ncbi:unnamed protein product [Onchocerca flexuosa]|uniref:NHL repeat protein n=1 Tax=Onchocerca flexuosa TaxID=387005 RepID=A0A183HUK9_9BILA|nr:unnamed protein product [Onchocerca flexuosa]
MIKNSKFKTDNINKSVQIDEEKAIQDNHRVQMFDNKGQFAGKFGTMGPGIGQFHHPQFIAIHKRTQNIYVTDSSNHRVCIFDHSGNPIFQFGSEGYQNGQLKFPRGIAVDDQKQTNNEARNVSNLSVIPSI